MNKINVLHLSDLHLTFNNDVNYNDFLNNLEKCITDYKDKIHIIAITGDIINKGEVKDFEKCYNNFILKIAEIAKCEANMIFCVPGNHDAVRDSDIVEYRKKYIEANKNTVSYDIKKQEFRKVLTRFEDYTDFYKKFHSDNNSLKSYGVDFVEIKGYNIVVVRVNSALYTHDENDYKELSLTQIQLDELSKEYNKIKKDKSIDLTIALIHHPDDWLIEESRKQFWNYLKNDNKLPVDIILHGHTHEGKITGRLNLDTFILSLVTGTTYEEGNKEKAGLVSSMCRLSFYRIDIDEKFIDGKLFIANNNGTFIPDRSNYDSVGNDGSFGIVFDKAAISEPSRIKMPFPIENSKKINQEYVEILDETIRDMWKFHQKCKLQFDAIINQASDNCKDDQIIKDAFLNIAFCAKTSLFTKKQGENVRIHFRKYNGNEHEHFCATLGQRIITPIKWNNGKNLIFHAYNNKRSLVKSLNEELYFDTNGEWKDFLTVPIWTHPYNKQKIPMYGFGISIKGDNSAELTMKLEVLSFLRIEELINSLIEDFCRFYLK